MSTSFREAFLFFHENAGGYVAADTIILARAEARAKELGLVFVWEDEQEPWDGDVPLAPTDLLEWVACYVPGRQEPIASLGMVATSGYSDPYRRVVEAELAAEALGVLDAEDAAEAARLAARATFAGVES